METIVSIIVQEDRVSLMVRLKYSLNIQKPPSLTCENMRLPEPIASTISSGLTSDIERKDNMIPEAVSPATVADPTHTRMMAAMSQASTSG